MAQQHHLGPVPFAFFRSEQPAELGLNAEQLEKICGNRHAAETLRLALNGELVIAYAIKSKVGGEIRERLILLAEVEEVSYLRGLARQIAVFLVIDDPHQAIGIAERKGPNENGIHNAENGGACAHTQSDNENRESGEADIASQRTESISEVLQDAVERGQPTKAVARRLRRSGSEFFARRRHHRLSLRRTLSQAVSQATEFC